MWSQQGGDTGVAWNVGAGVLVSCDHVGELYMLLGHWEVKVVIEMVVGE